MAGLRQRECDKCIHHTNGVCNAWECEFTHYRDVLNSVKKLKKIEGYLEAGGKDIDEIKRFFLYVGEDE